MKTPKVSVIMGIYNCAPTLQEALNSLYAQTYQDFEIILCDDGSTDNTYRIAYENQQTHDNIILLKNPCNMGLNQTLNSCLAVAKGEYIARMDGDDLCDPDRFRIEVDYLDTHPNCGVVSTPFVYFDERGEFRKDEGKGDIKAKDFLLGSPVGHASCMARLNVLCDVQGYSVDDKLLRVEDYHLWFKIFSKGYSIHMLKEPLYMMRDDRNAIARRTWKNRRNEAYVMRVGFKMIGLPWYYQIYACIPIIKYFIPSFFYKQLHRINN